MTLEGTSARVTQVTRASMAVRQAVPAVIAAHRRLDQAGTFDIAAAQQIEPGVARMKGSNRLPWARRCQRLGRRRAQMPRDGVTNQLHEELARPSCSVDLREFELQSPHNALVAIQIDAVDDSHDGRIDRRGLAAERVPCRAALEDDQDLLADAGADRIDRQQRGPARRVVERQRLDEQKLRAFELPVLLRRDDGTDDASSMSSTGWLRFVRPLIHDPDDGGVRRRLDGIERIRRFPAADEKHVLARRPRQSSRTRPACVPPPFHPGRSAESGGA